MAPKTKQDWIAYGVRMAQKHYAEGREYCCVSAATGWRDQAYRDGYQAGWNERVATA